MRLDAPTLAGVAAAFASVTALAYQVPRRVILEVGGRADAPFVDGFWERDQTQGFPFRWSSGAATVTFPGVAWGADQVLVVRASPGLRPPGLPPPTLSVSANGERVGDVPLEPAFRNYAFPLRHGLLSPTGRLTIGLRSPTFDRDDRPLGVVVEKVRLEPGAPGLRLPPVTSASLLGLAGLLSAAILLRLRPDLATVRLLAILGAEAGAVLVACALSPEWTALAAPRVCVALAFGYLGASQLRASRTRGSAPLEVLRTLGIESRRWRSAASGAVIAVAAAHFCWTILLPMRTWNPKDVRIYRGAGTLWLERGDYYDVPAFRSRFADDTPDSVGFSFTNPPTGAMLYAPLGLVPVDTAAYGWRLASVGFLVLAGLALREWGRVLGERSPDPVWLVLLLALSTETRTTLQLGQVGTLVLLLLAVALWCTAARRPRLCGAALGAAALVKVLPGFPVVLFVLRREWRVVGTAVAVGAVGLAASVAWGGLAPWGVFVHRVLPAISAPVSHFANQSVQAFLARLAGESPSLRAPFNFSFDPAAPGSAIPRVGAVVVALALAGAAAWRLRRAGDAGPVGRSVELATMVPLMLLVAPLVWVFYLLWLLVPIYALLGVLAARPISGRAQAGIVAGLVGAWLLMQVDTTAAYRIEGWPVPLMSLGLGATVLVFVSCLLALGALKSAEARP